MNPKMNPTTRAPIRNNFKIARATSPNIPIYALLILPLLLVYLIVQQVNGFDTSVFDRELPFTHTHILQPYRPCYVVDT